MVGEVEHGVEREVAGALVGGGEAAEVAVGGVSVGARRGVLAGLGADDDGGAGQDRQGVQSVALVGDCVDLVGE